MSWFIFHIPSNRVSERLAAGCANRFWQTAGLPLFGPYGAALMLFSWLLGRRPGLACDCPIRGEIPELEPVAFRPEGALTNQPGATPREWTRDTVRILNPHPFRVALGCAGSIVVLAASLSSAQSAPPPAGEHPPVGTTHSPSRFVAESRATLKGLHETMARLAAQVLADLGSDVPAEGGMASQSLMVESAKAGHQEAVLNREAAQIALKEYQENIFKRDKDSPRIAIRSQKRSEAAVTSRKTKKEV